MSLDLYSGSSHIRDVYYQNQIIAQIYKGSDLVWSHYQSGQTVFEQFTAGAYTFTPDVDGLYEITLVGGGSGGAAGPDQPKYSGKSRARAGASGAAVVGRWNLVGGRTYNIVVGAGGAGGNWAGIDQQSWGLAGGQSKFYYSSTNYVVCNGGTQSGAIWADRSTAQNTYVGTGGTYTYTGQVGIIQASNGNNGAAKDGYTDSPALGGASVYGGYGAGGNAQCAHWGDHYGMTWDGTPGYCKIRYMVAKVYSKTTAGSDSFTPDVTGSYEIRVVGAGGGCACFADANKYAGRSGIATGGSGAYIRAVMTLTRGTTYNLTVGAGGAGAGSAAYNTERTGGAGGNSTFNNQLIARGGAGGYCVNWNGAGTSTMTGGAGGTHSESGYTQLLTASNGNTGGTYSGQTYRNGGSALYQGYGAGGGGSNGHYAPYPGNGADGCIEIYYLTTT